MVRKGDGRKRTTVKGGDGRIQEWNGRGSSG